MGFRDHLLLKAAVLPALLAGTIAAAAWQNRLWAQSPTAAAPAKVAAPDQSAEYLPPHPGDHGPTTRRAGGRACLGRTILARL